MEKPLVFIDTNVLLDFYRSRNESGLTLLRRLDGLHDHIITSYQVEMEFKKNRQEAIKESLSKLEIPHKIRPAAFLHKTKSLKALNSGIDEIKERIKNMRQHLMDILADPTSKDPVYEIVQRLFTNSTDNNLSKDKLVKDTIRRLAWKRFIFGYPPRKRSDVSAGDAVNWEWIIRRAADMKSDVVIVSRDEDYGFIRDRQSFVNDWLGEEFKKRVSNKRSVTLVDRLSAAFKSLSIEVTDEEENDEEERIGAWKKYGSRANSKKMVLTDDETPFFLE